MDRALGGGTSDTSYPIERHGSTHGRIPGLRSARAGSNREGRKRSSSQGEQGGEHHRQPNAARQRFLKKRLGDLAIFSAQGLKGRLDDEFSPRIVYRSPDFGRPILRLQAAIKVPVEEPERHGTENGHREQASHR